MTPYKLKILNGVLKLKSFADVVLNIFGIKDLGTQTGNVSNGLVDWSIQHLTKTTAQWSGDTTTILLKGQLGIEDTGNTSFKVKIGNGIDLWSALSYVSGGAGGSQDLQSVTDIGATTTNAINTAGVTSDYLQIDTTATPTNAVGKVVWNDSLGTAEIGLKGGTINAKLAQDLYTRVVNKTNENLLRSNYQAVKVQSEQGQRLAINFAQANNDLNSADTIGIVAENINNNQEGFVITVGQITGLDTTGSLQGETWTDGDVLYLSPTTAGSLTNVKPNGSTGHIVVIGYVEYAHQNNGKIYVKIMNGWELSELHDCFISSPTNNQILTYESSTDLWKNKSVATALGYTPENLANKGVANGYAPLASDAKVDAAYLPAYVDEVLEYANLAAFPVTGASDKIYIALDTNKVYRWSGSVYIEVAANSGVWGAITGTIINQLDLKAYLDLIPRKIFKTADSSAITGTTSNTIVDSLLIPANTFRIGVGKINIRNVYSISSTRATRIYINTTNSLSGATLLASWSAGSGVSIDMGRIFVVKSLTSMEFYNASAISLVTEQIVQTAKSTITYNATVNNYIIVATQPSSVSDSCINSYINFEI